MKTQYSIILLALLFTTACTPSSTTIGQMEFPEGEVQHIVKANNIDWKPCPPNLPEGCEIVVLEGNPKGDGLFTVRFKLSGIFLMPAHTHPKEERATIIEGRAYVAFGNGATKEDANVFEEGDYYVNKPNEIHTVWADSGTIIQLTGIGPWEAHFIDKE